jgi:hypothetical protein
MKRWAQVQNRIKYTRWQINAKHLRFPEIPNRWVPNQYQTKKQIELRFLDMMDELKEWIEAPTDAEYWRLLELHIKNGKKAQVEAILAKQKKDREDQKRIEDIFGVIPDPYGPNSTEVIE